MNRFWQRLIVNIIIRAMSGVFLFLVGKGYVTSSESAIVAEAIAVLVFNVGLTVFNQLMNRWHIRFAKLADPSAPTGELIQIAKETKWYSKLTQAIGPKPTAEDVGLPTAEAMEDERTTNPLEPPRERL